MFRKALPLVLVLVATASLVISCGGKDEGVLAKVGDKKITMGDFNIAYKGITAFSRPPLVTQDDYENFLHTLINKELMVMAAREKGVDESEEFLRLKDQWERASGIRALHKEVTEGDVEFTLDEVKDFYVRSQTTLRARHVLVEDLPTAEEVKRKLDEGADFRKMVAEYSIDETTIPTGGEGAEVRRGFLAPQIEEVLFSLNEGDISEPVQSGRGYHVFEVLKRNVPSMDDFEANRMNMVKQLRLHKKNQNWREYVDQVRASLDIQFNEENVSYVNDLLPKQGEPPTGWQTALEDEDHSKVLATSTRGEITIGDALDRWGEQMQGLPYYTTDASYLKSVIESWLVADANYQEAIDRGLVGEKSVDLALQKQIEEHLVSRFFNELTRGVEAAEEEVRAEYEERKEELILEDRANLALISAVDRKQAEEALDELKRGVPFEEVSDKYNRGALKNLGGELGLRSAANLPPELHSYAFERLEIGELTPVVPHSRGFFVAKLVERDPSHKMSFEEAEESLRKLVLEQKKNEKLEEWIEEQKEKKNVEIYPEAIQAMMEEGEEIEKKIEAVVPEEGAETGETPEGEEEAASAEGAEEQS